MTPRFNKNRTLSHKTRRVNKKGPNRTYKEKKEEEVLIALSLHKLKLFTSELP